MELKKEISKKSANSIKAYSFTYFKVNVYFKTNTQTSLYITC